MVLPLDAGAGVPRLRAAVRLAPVRDRDLRTVGGMSEGLKRLSVTVDPLQARTRSTASHRVRGSTTLARMTLLRRIQGRTCRVQETRNDMAVDITNGLGPNWTFWGSGTAKIIWDSTKWIVLDQFEAGLPYTVMGIPKARPLTMLKLQSIKTQGFAWYASTHLSVNIPNEEAIRQRQIKLVIQHVEERRDHERVIIFGDFNSIPTNASVRKIASRCRLSARTRQSCRQSPDKRATHSTAGKSPSEKVNGSMTS